MKNTLRTISYTIFHLMVLLAFSDSVENERYIALGVAMIFFVIFLFVRPSKEEWKKSCQNRGFFYFTGATLFLIIGFSERMKAVDTWQDLNNFILWFKLCGILLFTKWTICNCLKVNNKYDNKLIIDYKQSFIGKLS